MKFIKRGLKFFEGRFLLAPAEAIYFVFAEQRGAAREHGQSGRKGAGSPRSRNDVKKKLYTEVIGDVQTVCGRTHCVDAGDGM